MKMLFIHRSVGHHLVEQGNLRELLKGKNVELDDYDNNTGLVTRCDGSVEENLIKMPGNNTNPENFSEFFNEWSALLDSYELIMIKSCYPNSHIKDEKQLQKIKKHYESIIVAFNKRKKPLIILTSPPLRPLFTNSTEAKLSKDLADWLLRQAGSNVRVFDFHNLLAEQKGRHKGMLKRSYRRFAPWDNHPNRAAHKNIAPQLVELISS